MYNYKKEQLFWRESDLTSITEKIEKELLEKYNYKGPYFLYNKNILLERLSKISKTLENSHLFYSVKSCSNIHILKIIKQFGNLGLDVVSGGELYRGLQADFSASNMVFAGVSKSDEEIQYAIENGLKSFHVESIEELKNISRIAKSMKKIASIALRLNPDISVDTHEFITTAKEENKFGISAYEVEDALEIIHTSTELKLIGLQVHLGSQILDISPYVNGLNFLIQKAKYIEEKFKIDLEYLSLGGGFGISYDRITDNEFEEFPLSNLAKVLEEANLKWRVDFEPGRFISAYTGCLISHVQYVKKKKNFNIIITDSGMTEYIRVALYNSKTPILPLIKSSSKGYDQPCDVVGPICESTDFFAKKISLPVLQKNDKLALLHTGAYGSVMSSNYNSRVLVPEILIENKNNEDSFQIIRAPQTKAQMLANEVNCI